MLIEIFLVLLITGLIGCVLTIILDTPEFGKIYRFLETDWGHFIIACLIISFAIGLFGGIISTSTKDTYQSLDSYYNHLKLKQRIETDLKTHEYEIENVKNGFTDLIRFEMQEQIVDLNNDIKYYNKVIEKHRRNKEHWLLNDFSNKLIRELDLFEPIL